MSPEQIALLTSLMSLIKMLSSWPVLAIVFALVIGPWVMALFIAMGNQKRFEEVVHMYENNVRLVEKYEKIACELKDIVIMNTQAQTSLTEVIRDLKNKT